MHITYMGHSGFLVETASAYYLFDYIRGTLPDFSSEKPLYVLASHSHEDHFSPLIFESTLASKATQYLLSSDIQKKYKRRPPEWLTKHADSIKWVSRGSSFILKNAAGRALVSTDIGVAFAIRENDGTSFYHAGDLNWWHWEGESKAWNRNMESNYKHEIDKLHGETFDAAFVPLDPRLESAYYYGLDYFMKQVHADHIFPMHFWEDYSVISRYLREHPIPDDQNTIIHLIKQEDESYEI